MSGTFDVLGPLPTGVEVLEASAGTGKTYTIAALAARYVAAGTPLEDILIVTFTRMATGELRERVRDRLVSAERVLTEHQLGGAPSSDDAIGQLLVKGTDAEIEVRRRRLARAVADFDAATITTTHGFCLEALSSLGFSGDVASDCAFVEDVSDLIGEVVDDLFVRRFHDKPVEIPYAAAKQIADLAIKNPTALLEPRAAPHDTLAAMHVRLAEAARRELEARKRLTQVMTFDDLLTRLDATLTGDGGADVAQRLQDRYKVVLVDEFQDTDPVQWSIMHKAFGSGTLVLIGDPKQAIYAFRGGDVYAYLEAAQSAGEPKTLATNWRSDQGLIDAHDALFGNAQLGHPGIAYRPVQATSDNQASRLHNAPKPEPLRVKVVDRGRVGTTARGYASTGETRDHIARDVADDVVALLSSNAMIEDRDSGEHKHVEPGDIAVLVRINRDASRVRDALEKAGVPAVINGAGSVFASEPARDWLWLLEALERPSYPPRAHTAALTVFFGWSAEQVACATDADWESVHQRLHQWAHILRTGGVALLLETLTVREALPARVLAFDDGERELTDLRHVAQLLHQVATTEDLGTSALTTWLRKRINEAEQETDEERSRRLESDADAVQVLTIHRSKGLEFPIVYLPYLWAPTWIPESDQPVFFHDPANGDARTLNVGLQGPEWKGHKLQHKVELRGEDLRLAYVALTRAKHQAVVWWAGVFDSKHSPLSRLVFSRSEDGEIATDGAKVPSDEEALAAFGALAPGCIAAEMTVPGLPLTYSPGLSAPVALSVATFDREIDRLWRRTSYSDLTAFTGHEPRVGSEPESALRVDDEVVDGEAVEGSELLLGEMPGGVLIGTLVHEVMEETDFAAVDLRASVSAALEERMLRRRVDIGPRDAFLDGLCAAIETPFGPLGGGLRGLEPADRVDEMSFEMPLVGGDSATGTLAPAAIGEVLRSHLAADDPLAAYADRLADAQLRSAVRGFLTGSIDLVFRVDGKYGLADYKTNRLGDWSRPLTAADYGGAAVRDEMYRSHYALQGLLYTVALHRYLRWRLPGYDPAEHLLGFYYLFVRGMTGSRGGVFAWTPPAGLVTDLSDLLDRGS